MNIKTTVGQVAMVGGDRYDQPSSILVDERTTRFAKGRKRGKSLPTDSMNALRKRGTLGLCG